MTRRALYDEQGNALVETALTLTILLSVVFGILQLCVCMYYYNYVGEAARQATRFAIVRGSACADLTGGCPATSDDIETYVKGLGFPAIDTSKLTVTASWPSCEGCNHAGNVVKVQVQYHANLPIPFTPGLNVNLSSTSQEVISK